MRKFLLLLLINFASASFQKKINSWWLDADNAIILPDRIELNYVKASRCNNKKPEWSIRAEKLLVQKDLLIMKKPSLNFAGFSLPVFFSELPLDGTGKSGFLPPKIGNDKSRGRYLSLPFYLWFSKGNSAEISMETSSLLGNMLALTYSAFSQAYSFKTWAGFAKKGLGWRMQLKSHLLHIDWADVDNSDMFWQWSLDDLGVVQGRLERSIKLSFQDFVIEYFSPKVLSSLLDKVQNNDYAWEPRFSWAKAKDSFSHMLQYTSFVLRKKLIGDIRPSKVGRLVIMEEYNNDNKFLTGDLSSNIFIHYVQDDIAGARKQAMVPIAFLNWHKNIALAGNRVLEPTVTLRLAKYVDQQQMPLLDSELLQQNISTWMGPRQYAGDDRISDINSISGSLVYNINNTKLLFGFKSHSKTKVCLQATCADEPGGIQTAFAFEGSQGLNSFLILEHSAVKYFVANYTRPLLGGDFVFGYRKNADIDLNRHWYFDYNHKISGFNLGLGYAFMKTKNDLFHKGHVLLKKQQGCWGWGLAYSWQNLGPKKNWQELGLKINLMP